MLTGYPPARVKALACQLGITPRGSRDDDVAALTDRLSDPTVIAKLVAELDPQARAILEHLEREGKDGSVESTERSTSRGPAGGAVEQMLSRGLLVARDSRHVAVPREVALCLRDGRTTRARADAQPPLVTTQRDPALIDRSAAGAAFELVRHVELLLEHWGSAAPSALRAGGLSVRELKAAARLLHMDERAAALRLEIAMAGDLLAVGTGPDGESAWLPTDAFDIWSTAPVAERWTRLALAWLASPRLTGLVGGRENGKPVNALVPDLERMWLPETRRMALLELASTEPGSVLAAGTGVASLVERLTWLRPRRPAARAQAVAWVVEESAVVGVTALGGMSTHGRALLSLDDPAHETPPVLEPLLPEPVDHVLLQADLTAWRRVRSSRSWPGSLATVADVESRGGATVYRFTESSVRRAFDSGWSAAEVHDFVAVASRTPVPQALTYLVDDVSRRFGTIRVGAAESFLRSDDEAALAELVHHPGPLPCGCAASRRPSWSATYRSTCSSPGCASSGAAPVVEAPDGTVRVARREVLRARTPRSTTAGIARRSRARRPLPGSRRGSPRRSPRSGR